MINLGFTQNLVYDLQHGKLTIKYEFDEIKAPLTWNEETKVVKYYNLAKKHGVDSIYGAKLYYVVLEILQKYYNKKYNKSVGLNTIIKLDKRIQ